MLSNNLEYMLDIRKAEVESLRNELAKQSEIFKSKILIKDKVISELIKTIDDLKNKTQCLYKEI